MNPQHLPQPYASHSMATYTPPLWEPLHPKYPPLMQPLPHQTPFFTISDQGSFKPLASTNSMDTIRWKMQLGKHRIEFCPKCGKDLIHRSSSFGTRLDGIHREEECEKQRSLNKQFGLKYRSNRVEREVNRTHASAAEPDEQAPGSAPDTTSRIEIVRLLSEATSEASSSPRRRERRRVRHSPQR
jgi:predicted RNA-binding Zn-ribbon protein involved in translation (DUF1610 family)